MAALIQPPAWIAPVDAAIVAAYLGVVVVVGLVAGRREKDTADFLVGGRRVPWLVVLGSIVATEMSAATFLAVPGVGFGENMNYLQFTIGWLLARILVGFAFLGAFYAAGAYSVYQYLRTRFGGTSQVTASLYFMVTRLLASGVRLMIAVSGVAVILDLPFGLCLAVFVLLTLVYTAAGGIKAVVWTDCVQALVFISAGVATLVYLLGQTGWGAFVESAAAAGKFEVFRWAPAGGARAWLADPQWLPAAVLFGLFISAASHGTDQDTTQRMLSCRDAARARRSVILSGLVSPLVVTLFLLVGVALFVHYGAAGAGMAPDRAFPAFIASDLPAGLRGLLLAGVLAAAMSSLDSTMAALGSSAMLDLARPLLGEGRDERGWLRLSRLLTILFALILAGLALIMRNSGTTFLWLAYQITSLTYAGLLGLFLLGLFTRRGNDRWNPLAALAGSATVGVCLLGARQGWLELAWTWHLPLGTMVTFGVGCLLPRRT